MIEHDKLKMLDRIGRGKIHPNDIKHANLLTDDQIADIPYQSVYTWVRNGNWKQRHFHKWLKVMRVVE